MKTYLAVAAACVGAFALAQAGLAASETSHRQPEMVPMQGAPNLSVGRGQPGGPTTFKFYRFTSGFTPQACRADMGEVVKSVDGKLACRSSRAIPGGAEFLSFNFEHIVVQY